MSASSSSMNAALAACCSNGDRVKRSREGSNVLCYWLYSDHSQCGQVWRDWHASTDSCMQSWLDNPSKAFSCRHTRILTGGRGVELRRREGILWLMSHNATSLPWFSRTAALGRGVFEAEAEDAAAAVNQAPEQSWLVQAKAAE